MILVWETSISGLKLMMPHHLLTTLRGHELHTNKTTYQIYVNKSNKEYFQRVQC